MGSYGNCVELNKKVSKHVSQWSSFSPLPAGCHRSCCPHFSNGGIVLHFNVSILMDTYYSCNLHCLIIELCEFFICFGFTSSEP